MKLMETRVLLAGAALSALLAGQAGAWALMGPAGQGRAEQAGAVTLVEAEGNDADPAAAGAEGDDAAVDPGQGVEGETGPDLSVAEPQVDAVPEQDDVMTIGGSPDFCEACAGTSIEDEPVMADVVEAEGPDGEVVAMEDGGATPEEIRDLVTTTGVPVADSAQVLRGSEGSGEGCDRTRSAMYCND